jgi:hypothetical protein
MRKLIVRAFNISLDGVSAEYGTEYFEWCMSGIDPRVPEVAGPHQLQATTRCSTRRASCTSTRTRSSWAGSPTRQWPRTSLRAAPRPTTRGPASSTPRKVVFSRTLKTADWANTTIVVGDTAEEIDQLRQATTATSWSTAASAFGSH